MHPEDLRESFRPERISLLLVGESAPAGMNFFYKADSRLFRATRAAFAKACGDTCPEGEAFLSFFKVRGCFLDDLCLGPVDKLERQIRYKARKEAVPALTERIQSYQLGKVVSVFKGAEKQILGAARAAKVPEKDLHGLPFPLWHWNEYVEGLAVLISRVAEIS